MRIFAPPPCCCFLSPAIAYNSSTCLPRRRATSNGSFMFSSPSKVARTTLCGFVEPRTFVRTSWTPAACMTARTAPPAMTPVLADDGVRQRVVDQRDADQVLLRRLDGLLDGHGDFARLARAEADVARAVADDHERREREVLAALDHLGHAVDRDDLVGQVKPLRCYSLFRLSHYTPFGTALGRGLARRLFPAPLALVES